MQGIQKLWFKVILATQTEVQTNITRQKDRSLLLFNVFAVGNRIPYHCLLKYTKTWRILWDCLQAMDTTHSLFTIAMTPPWSSWSSAMTTISTSEKEVLVPMKAIHLQLWQREWKGGWPRYSHSTHSILSDNGRSGSSTKDEGEVDSGSQHTFPSNQQEV